jgi:NAD+ kinase
MKVVLFGRNLKMIEPVVTDAGFKIVKKNPDFVISYGGDGTLMLSEYEFPGIPKVVLKGSLVCKKASSFSNEEVLAKIKKGNFSIKEFFKLEASVKNKKLIAINDVVVHNKNPRHAIRYHVWVNESEIAKDIIGDGVVLATPFGSTAYYRSITDSFFELGIGMAFNNSTEQADHIVLKEDSKIKIKIKRGPAVVYADNQDEYVELGVDDIVRIKKSNKKMKLVVPF